MYLLDTVLRPINPISWTKNYYYLTKCFLTIITLCSFYVYVESVLIFQKQFVIYLCLQPFLATVFWLSSTTQVASACVIIALFLLLFLERVVAPKINLLTFVSSSCWITYCIRFATSNNKFAC